MSSEFDRIRELPHQIDKQHAEEAVQQLLQYDGHSANVKIFYYEGRVLACLETSGYVMLRTIDSYGHWGLVIKGNEQEVSTLIKVEENCLFQLYDQKVKNIYKEGEVVQIEFEWLTFELELSTKESGRSLLNATQFKK